MIKTNIEFPILKEIETDLFRTLQQTYSDAFTQLLTDSDLKHASNGRTNVNGQWTLYSVELKGVEIITTIGKAKNR